MYRDGASRSPRAYEQQARSSDVLLAIVPSTACRGDRAFTDLGSYKSFVSDTAEGPKWYSCLKLVASARLSGKGAVLLRYRKLDLWRYVRGRGIVSFLLLRDTAWHVNGITKDRIIGTCVLHRVALESYVRSRLDPWCTRGPL